VTKLSRRGRRLAGGSVALGVVVVLVVALLIVVHLAKGVFGGSSGDYTGDGTGTALVVVHPGDSSTAIADTLLADKVVRSAGAFTSAAEADPRSRQLGPGTYRLHQHMKASLALSLMLQPGSLVDYKVTIPEGFTAKAIVARIAADTPITTAALNAALHSPSSLGLPSYANGHVEGFLYPATYDVQPGTTATQLLKQMVDRYQEEATSLHIPATGKLRGLSAYQIVTLASIVQREGRLVQDFPKIAEVFTNRYSQGLPLGSDATLFYVLGPNNGPLTQSELESSSPYNTRSRPGLPPTPINSPGEAALEAVIHHPNGPLMYFVTIDKAGHTAFATTQTQFNQLVQQSRANGVS
jgi:UPF0755 protein